MPTTFTPNPAAMAQLLRGPSGAVAVHMLRLGTQVQILARRYVGKDTRQTEQTIVKRLEATSAGPAVRIVAGTEYALAHHQGTRPHVIRPKRPGGVLRFPIGGRLVFATYVNHPGTRANPFLRRALTEVMIRQR